MNEPAPRRSIAALGDVLDPNCFGGAPNQFFKAGVERGFAHDAWRVDLAGLRRDRLWWNAGRILTGRRPGGFQFSNAGRRSALARADRSLLATDVISFHQHVPPFDDVENARRDPELLHRRDVPATVPQPTAIDQTLSKAGQSEALEYEREAFRSAKRIVVCQAWTLRSLMDDYGYLPKNAPSILAGAELRVYPGVRPEPKGVAGKDRPFVIGFIGKDWRRKGLKVAVDVGPDPEAHWLEGRQYERSGSCPSDCPYRDEVDCLGFIDKRKQFGPFLHGCDIGCLFSAAEAMGSAFSNS